MQQPQQVQTHHQIVEEILPEQMSDEVTKEVINQFLPQRKRKPRVPKTPGKQNPSKIIKLEPQASGSETITTITNIVEPVEEMIEDSKEQVTEMIEQVGEEQGSEHVSSDVKVKGEGKTSKDKSSRNP
jgi:dissimilatory sulfite reductase (desulfoviridin) alpha/beta subunit